MRVIYQRPFVPPHLSPLPRWGEEIIVYFRDNDICNPLCKAISETVHWDVLRLLDLTVTANLIKIRLPSF